MAITALRVRDVRSHGREYRVEVICDTDDGIEAMTAGFGSWEKSLTDQLVGKSATAEQIREWEPVSI